MSETATGAAARVCHEEQMAIWAGEISSRLATLHVFRDDLVSEDTIRIHAGIADELRQIIESAFEHPELDAAPVQSDDGWQPIETAEKIDQRPIEACRMGKPEYLFGRLPIGGYAEPPETTWWCDHAETWKAAQRPHDNWEPTHWRPLPAPPVAPPAPEQGEG